jgi:hypothetical protein
MPDKPVRHDVIGIGIACALFILNQVIAMRRSQNADKKTQEQMKKLKENIEKIILEKMGADNNSESGKVAKAIIMLKQQGDVVIEFELPLEHDLSIAFEDLENMYKNE